jgi:menaquinone-dependent protoporphyrinogen oxidase
MNNNKVLIVYGTRMSVTQEYSLEIANILKTTYDLDVDVINLKTDPFPNLENYTNFIIGSGIRMGKWTREPLQFLKNDFGGKNVALFVSSVKAGDEKTYEKAYAQYILEILSDKPHFSPVASAAFGGRIIFKGVTVIDNRNINKVRDWAFQIGKIFVA